MFFLINIVFCLLTPLHWNLDVFGVTYQKFKHDVLCMFTEKAALMSPDDEVQKSDISSSSQGMVEKEALGPLLLEVC